MVIYKISFRRFAYISRLNGLLKYTCTLIAHTILSEPGPEPVLRFGGSNYIFSVERFLFLSYVQNKFS